MKNVNLLYISMTRKEQLQGFAYLLFQMLLLPSLLLSAMDLLFPDCSEAVCNFIFFCINFAAVSWIFRHFWADCFQDLHGRLRSIFWKAVLGVIVSQLLMVLMNDLLNFFFHQYYEITATGPKFRNLNDAGIAAMVQQHYWLMFIGTVFLVPPVEEILYRGLVFGGLYAKSPPLAYVVSVCLFAAIHMFAFIGSYRADYLIINFLQYVPAGIFLAWMYTSSESIFTPILMHMAINAIGIYSMR